jgi:hypothetical protein
MRFNWWGRRRRYGRKSSSIVWISTPFFADNWHMCTIVQYNAEDCRSRFSFASFGSQFCQAFGKLKKKKKRSSDSLYKYKLASLCWAYRSRFYASSLFEWGRHARYRCVDQFFGPQFSFDVFNIVISFHYSGPLCIRWRVYTQLCVHDAVLTFHTPPASAKTISLSDLMPERFISLYCQSRALFQFFSNHGMSTA